MRPMALIALVELAVILGAGFFLIRGLLASRAAARAVSALVREKDMRISLAESYRLEERNRLLADMAALRKDGQEQVKVLREELAKALDRVQAPEYAVAESMGSRQKPMEPEKPEKSLGDLDREQREQMIMAHEEALRQADEELARRGIDPSELSAEMSSASVFGQIADA